MNGTGTVLSTYKPWIYILRKCYQHQYCPKRALSRSAVAHRERLCTPGRRPGLSERFFGPETPRDRARARGCLPSMDTSFDIQIPEAPGANAPIHTDVERYGISLRRCIGPACVCHNFTRCCSGGHS